MNIKFFYNSIYFSGLDPSNSNHSRVSGFEITGGTDIEIINNIVMNQVNLASSSTSKVYCIYLHSLPQNFTSNYNNLFAPNSFGSVGFYLNNKITLEEWINSFSPKQDSASISSNPFFIVSDSGNLRIQITSQSPVNNRGYPVSITDDIDGDIRNIQYPDIGADEFTPANRAVYTFYNSGWNLVSIPLILSDYKKTSVFPSTISEAYSFNGSYFANIILQNGTGYWLKFLQPTYFPFGGDSMDSINILLNAGWNLIGSVDHYIPAPDNPIIISFYYEYNNGFNITDSIIPGKTYLVKTSTSGEIQLGGSEYSKNHSEINQLNQLIFKIDNEYEQKLYFNTIGSFFNKSFQMPPEVPYSNHDIRFASNKIIETLNHKSNANIPINIKSISKKIKVRCILNNEEHDLNFFFNIQNSNSIRKIKLENNFEYGIETNSLKHLSLMIKKISSVPSNFRLGQNYPNPFNNTTTIKFQIPKKINATITIYNLLGQEINQLVLNDLNNGFYEVKFDENLLGNLASGVYIYQFRANAENKIYKNSKKFLFLKGQPI